MKKIRLLLVLPFLFAFVILANRSFAQVPQGITNNPFFDMSNAALTSFIPVGDTTPKEISIFPFSKIIIQPKSFTDNVNIYIFRGDWDKLKTILPKDQSPISAYYLVFVNSKGKMVAPTNQISVQSYNNYVDTDTFFYPLGAVGNIDVANSRRWSGHIVVNTLLPIQDSAFIVSANKILDKNDPSLHPSTNSVTPQPNAVNQQASARLQKLFALVLLIGIAFLISFMMWGNKKSSGRKK